jgi:transcriptional regulator with XRE-family HTH domain
MTSDRQNLARQWRIANGWSVDQLADLTGYSRSSIVFFERGYTGTNKPIDEYAWFRFRRICHSVSLDRSGNKFNWGTK